MTELGKAHANFLRLWRPIKHDVNGTNILRRVDAYIMALRWGFMDEVPPAISAYERKERESLLKTFRGPIGYLNNR